MSSLGSGSTVRLIINGRANLSRRLNRSLQRAIHSLREQNLTVEIFTTNAAGDAERFAQDACTKQHICVVAVGGDGTLHQVINGVMKQGKKRSAKIAIGLVPAGTANDFASSVDIRSHNTYQTLLASHGERVKLLDLGKVGSRYFINFVTGGFGAEATRKAVPWVKSVSGPEAYLFNSARHLLKTPIGKGHFQSRGWQWQGRFLAFGIGNGRQTGGGCVLCPKAKLDDGKLDLCIIPATFELRKILTSWVRGPFAVAGTLFSLRNPLQLGVIGYVLKYYKELVVRQRVSALDIDFEQAIKLNLDGEPSSPRKDFHVTVMQQKIKFILP